MGAGKGWTMTTAINALSYPYFEHLVWKRFGADIKAGTYNLVHRITPLSPTINSPIAPKCAAAGVPFVMGPLNGGVPWPKGFDAERRQEREWLSYVRSAYKLIPGRDSTLKAASAILTGSRHTQSEIPARYRDKTVYLPENAIDPTRFNLVAKQDISGPLRACFIGRLVPYKGPDMLLEAAAPLLRDGRLMLDMIGDGPMRGALERQAAQLGYYTGSYLSWQSAPSRGAERCRAIQSADLSVDPRIRRRRRARGDGAWRGAGDCRLRRTGRVGDARDRI